MTTLRPLLTSSIDTHRWRAWSSATVCVSTALSSGNTMTSTPALPLTTFHPHPQVAGVTIGHQCCNTYLTSSPLTLVRSLWRIHTSQVAGVIIGARNASHVGDLEKVFSFEMDDGAPVWNAVLVAAWLGGAHVRQSFCDLEMPSPKRPSSAPACLLSCPGVQPAASLPVGRCTAVLHLCTVSVSGLLPPPLLQPTASASARCWRRGGSLRETATPGSAAASGDAAAALRQVVMQLRHCGKW